ncbi:TetR/AcrR family transcriptional regulator [Alkalicaulis satelles]|uniref:TetR/AcrR family transcriptional regulator n=1 Tax=Alkalicaulis satelles TaxID=2609175 RepID=A0A5M6ZDX1_9PROT|nr:TetR/AcrR family transcriptional regulator [Alkalicaulis satelles]KAA5802420.1 TetR/AcrR family transcriptional regulator [Alkalicaulis satelles]
MSGSKGDQDRPAGSRARLIAAAGRLFHERGYAATGLSEILAAAGAPKGSLYHHFPDGKAGLAAAALEAATDALEASLRAEHERARDAAGMIEGYGALLAGWLEASHFTRGCPVATVALEVTPGDDVAALAVQGAFARWRKALGDAIRADGVAPERAGALAGFALSAIEGALILARTDRDSEPVRAAAREVASLVRAARP